MKLIKFTIVSLLAIITLGACNKTYLAQNFNQKTANHKLIAVMPPEIIYTGKIPDKLTPALKAQLEEQESKAFQISYLNHILQKSNAKGGYRIDFQPTETTINLLKKNNITIQDAWTKDPVELCKILGVQAIVRTRVEKNRLMSDLASYGITVGKEVVDVILDEVKKSGTIGQKAGEVADAANPNNSVNPALQGKTFNIYAKSNVLDGQTGAILWGVSNQNQADWEITDEMIIEGINRQFARNFPYGLKK